MAKSYLESSEESPEIKKIREEIDIRLTESRKRIENYMRESGNYRCIAENEKKCDHKICLIFAVLASLDKNTWQPIQRHAILTVVTEKVAYLEELLFYKWNHQSVLKKFDNEGLEDLIEYLYKKI